MASEKVQYCERRQGYNALTPRVFYTELITIELQNNKTLFHLRIENTKIAPTLPIQALNEATKLGTSQEKELSFVWISHIIRSVASVLTMGDLFTSIYCGHYEYMKIFLHRFKRGNLFKPMNRDM
jgi:hypothetical protein